MTNVLYDALIAPHAGNPAPFLVDDHGVTTTYDAFVRRAAQMANVLLDAGVQPGDRVVAQVPKTADAMALYAGSLQAGAVYLPLNNAYTEAELGYFLADATPKLVVCAAATEEMMRRLCQPIAARVMTLDDGETGTLSLAASGAKPHCDPVPRGPDDLAGLLYTSGTTGRAKGAMMSHRNLLSNASALTALWQITDKDNLLHALPIFHTHGLFVAMNTSLLSGACVRFMARFDLDGFIAALPEATLVMGVPTFYTRLLNDHRFSAETCAKMRLFISGSAPLLAETHTAFAARTGHQILERYGMTETNMITSNPYAGARIAGTVGFALPGIEVVVTQDGHPLPHGEVGMIEVRGDNVFQGYWNMPDKTREDLRTNGFFITGDLGVIDSEGRVSIVGRQKDLVISGGYNIYPKEVEDLLNAIDGIEESAVFGIPDPDLGEQVVAALVTEHEAFDLAGVQAHVASALAAFKRPKRYVIHDSLPRNAMGKVQKNILRQMYSD
ncbi:MAG: AMP-binding protein [Yoonia sp.]|uniref:AMP-binding protein n=1 Tax=Yoonia sp. TaxID=2212373 RepID=UPI00273ECB7F|nr:AMP-binding protein [Yoonia sp.]MDP5085422.1 AMP-binding protein [Yoonia sp.]